MKIGIVTEYYYPSLGGVTEHVHHFSKEAKKLGHEPVIITGNAGDAPFIDENDVRIIRIGKSMPIYSNESIARVTIGFSVGRKLKEIFRAEQFDIIHIHSPFVPTLPALAQRYSNTITFATLHTQFDSNFYLRNLKKHAQLYANGLHGRIAVSKLCIDSISRYIDTDFRIIPNGVDTEKFNGRHEKVAAFDDEKLNIFFLSRLEPRNGLEYLIKAFGILKKERSDCRLIIGGDGPLKTHFKSMVSPSIKSDVHFIGRVNGVRPNYYSTADIFCFPTTRASFGITILEAMASGIPTVAFSMPAYEGIIESGGDGILCGHADPKNLARGLGQLLDSKELRENMGRRAKISAKKYSWGLITERVIDYYEEVIQKS